MKVIINTKTREFTEEYLKKESALVGDELDKLRATVVTTVSMYLAYVIKQICGKDRGHQLRMIDSVNSAIAQFLDVLNAEDKES